MSQKEDKAYKEWGEELLSNTEESEHEALKAWLALPVAREIFRGTIGQKELYRRMNEVHALKEELEASREELRSWYEEEAPKNEELLAERDQLRAQLEKVGSGGPPPSKQSGLSISDEDLKMLKERADKAEQLDKLLPAVLGDMSRVLQDSIKNNFEIDPSQVIQVSLKKGVPPFRAYLDMTAEERSKRAEAAREEERKKWFEEGRKSAASSSPDHFQPSGPSLVDFIQEMNTGKRESSTPESRKAAALKEFIDLGVDLHS